MNLEAAGILHAKNPATFMAIMEYNTVFGYRYMDENGGSRKRKGIPTVVATQNTPVKRAGLASLCQLILFKL